MMRINATIQLVTMLFVTGNGPSLNNASADEETPGSSPAKADAAEEKVASVSLKILPRDMESVERMDQGKGKQKGQPPTLRQPLKWKHSVGGDENKGVQADWAPILCAGRP